jgi:hypothetical protein
MWKAREEVRLRRAVDWFLANVPRIWHLAEHGDDDDRFVQRLTWSRLDKLDPRERGHYRDTIDGLAAEFGREALTDLVPELYFHPADGLWRDVSPSERCLPRALALHVCRLWVEEQAPDTAVELAAARLRHVVTNALGNHEVVEPYSSEFYLEPTADRCASLVGAWRDRPAAAAAIREFVDGAWDRPLEIPPPVRERWEKGGQSHVLEHYLGKSTYAYFRLTSLSWTALVDLAERGELTRGRLHDLARRCTSMVPVHLADRAYEAESPGERAAAPVVLEFLWESVQALDAEGLARADDYYGTRLRGTRFVLKACEHVEALGLASVTAQGSETLPRALRWLADAHPDSGETIGELTLALRRFAPRTLRALLPHAPATQDAFLQALGWEAAIPLAQVARRIAARQHETEYDETGDAPNCSDPESGVVDREAIATAIERAGAGVARDVLAALRAGEIEIANTIKLIEAVAGWNRKQVEKGLAQLGQVSLKALGLLPLERGADEVIERYKRLRQAARDCRKFGPERQANTRAAVAAGLANLAQTAGYGDVSRMEWTLEARISDAAADPRTAVGEYELTIEMPDLDPAIVVRRGERTLATVPPAVRKAKEYAALKETAAELKAQVARFRKTLEEAMVEGRPFAAQDLAQAARVPTLHRLLDRLVLLAPDGFHGLLRGDGLVAVDGTRRPLADGSEVAHPVRMIAAGTLREWQAAVVAQRIVQPFKQVFREVYALTEKERESEATARFAGHALDGRKVRRLLAARGWEVEPGDVPLPFRRHWSARLRAWFDFPEARHYLGEDEPVASGELYFTAESADGRWGAVRRMRLADVPPVLVSEAFRDADLLVSVARPADEAFSPESCASRGAAVVALAARLGVSAVETEGRFVKVAGKLARYRVHLGSGTVHVEPANAVCILPAPKRSRTDGIWLPFAEADERLAEVVSKVVLLAADETIKDQAILAQIRAAVSAGASELLLPAGAPAGATHQSEDPLEGGVEVAGGGRERADDID